MCLPVNTTVLYTSALLVICRKMYQYCEEMINSFSKKYGIKILVYFAMCEDMVSAIAREKALNGVTRAKKIALIESVYLIGKN